MRACREIDLTRNPALHIRAMLPFLSIESLRIAVLSSFALQFSTTRFSRTSSDTP